MTVLLESNEESLVFTLETPNVKLEIGPDKNWATFGGFGVWGAIIFRFYYKMHIYA